MTGSATTADLGASGLRCAAVDVGSNSVRLLVTGEAGQRITRDMVITRLATGVDATGHLDDAALARTLDVLARFRETWQAHGVPADRVRIAATSAVRDADDRDRFFAGVRERTGVYAEMLSGRGEAELAYAGAVAAVDAATPTMVVDIGGGSTELVVGTRAADSHNRVLGSVSLQLGCVRGTERFFPDDPPDIHARAAAETEIRALLDGAYRALASQMSQAGQHPAILDGGLDIVAVAGTATTLAALYLGLDTYAEDRIHGTRVPADDITTLTNRLFAMPAHERAQLGPMQPGREDVIHAGALVMDRVLARFGATSVIVSEADGLDGLAASITA